MEITGIEYGGTDVKRMTVTLKLVKKELPRSKDTPAGLHRCKYYVRYFTSDGYLLAEHEATEFDMTLFDRFGKSE